MSLVNFHSVHLYYRKEKGSLCIYSPDLNVHVMTAYIRASFQHAYMHGSKSPPLQETDPLRFRKQYVFVYLSEINVCFSDFFFLSPSVF